MSFDMFNFLRSKDKLSQGHLTWSLGGLHCTSCAVNIDLTLEDLEGVSESNTNYAKSVITVHFDPAVIDESSIKEAIEELGYQVL